MNEDGSPYHALAFKGALLHRFYTELLEPAFTYDELESEDDLLSSLVDWDADPPGLCLVRVDDDGRVVAGAVGERYAAGVLLLGYLVVRAGQRDRGLGTRLMEEIAGRWYSHPDCHIALAEIADPRHAGHEGTDALDRLRFYDRLGARVICAPYFQPRLHEDSERVPHMLLIVLWGVRRGHAGEGGRRSGRSRVPRAVRLRDRRVRSAPVRRRNSVAPQPLPGDEHSHPPTWAFRGGA